jgi:hypothetical protein
MSFRIVSYDQSTSDSGPMFLAYRAAESPQATLSGFKLPSCFLSTSTSALRLALQASIDFLSFLKLVASAESLFFFAKAFPQLKIFAASMFHPKMSHSMISQQQCLLSYFSYLQAKSEVLQHLSCFLFFEEEAIDSNSCLTLQNPFFVCQMFWQRLTSRRYLLLLCYFVSSDLCPALPSQIQSEFSLSSLFLMLLAQVA